MPDDRYSDESPPDRDRYGDEPDRGRPDDRERRYDEIDVSRPRHSELSWLDRQFRDTSMVVLVIFSLCCAAKVNTVASRASLLAKIPTPPSKWALVVTIISGILVVIGVVFQLLDAGQPQVTKVALVETQLE